MSAHPYGVTLKSGVAVNAYASHGAHVTLTRLTHGIEVAIRLDPQQAAELAAHLVEAAKAASCWDTAPAES